MTPKAKKIAIFSGIGIAGAIGTFFLIRFLRDRKAEKDYEENIQVGTSSTGGASVGDDVIGVYRVGYVADRNDGVVSDQNYDVSVGIYGDDRPAYDQIYEGDTIVLEKMGDLNGTYKAGSIWKDANGKAGAIYFPKLNGKIVDTEKTKKDRKLDKRYYGIGRMIVKTS